MLSKVKNIHYNYHLSNFLAGLLKSQKNLVSKYKYFFTKTIFNNVEALARTGLISSYKIFSKGPSLKAYLKKRVNLIVYLKYINEGPLIRSVYTYSTPGRRLYVNHFVITKLTKLYPGSFIYVSTSQGVMDHLEAFKKKIGGLLLYRIN